MYVYIFQVTLIRLWYCCKIQSSRIKTEVHRNFFKIYL